MPYTSVIQSGRDTIYHRYIDDKGIRRTKTVHFKPFLGLEAPKSNKGFKTMFGRPVETKIFDSISDMQRWKKDNKDMFDIHGDINPVYQFIALNYPGQVLPQKDKMVIFNIDIEVYCTKGFPDPEEAKWPIVTFTIQDMVSKKFYVFGDKHYVNEREDVEYIHCEDETDLLQRVIIFFKSMVPDIITGWYIDGFDIPYFVHRIQSVLGPNYVKKLSPIGKVTQHTKNDFNSERTTYTIEGTQIWDYKELYLKFTFDPREQYTLDYIAKFELGEGKLDFKSGETRSLAELYDTDYQTFVDYNIQDCQCVYDIDDKMRYIDLGLRVSYMAKCQFKDVFGTVGIWDAYLYNALLERKIFAPPRGDNRKVPFPGGWVEDPKRGLKRWTMVFDIASSYPNSIISYNMSPETIVDYHKVPKELREVADKFGSDEGCLDVDRLVEEAMPLLQKYNLCMAPNGHFFRTDIDGFIPVVVDYVFNERVKMKNEIKALKKERQTRKVKDQIAGLDAAQLAVKVMMNSLYGALSNEWFRYFDMRMASGITAAGRVSVKGSAAYLEKHIPGMQNMYTDTDSIFLDLFPYVAKRFDNLQKIEPKRVHDFLMMMNDQVIEPKLAEFFDKLGKGLNFRRNTLTMEFESLSDFSLFLEKKKYVMKLVNMEGTEIWDETKLKIKGIEIVRTSTPQYCRDKLKEVIVKIFDTMDEAEVHKFVKEIRKEFNELPPEQLAFPRGVNMLNKYRGVSKGIPIACRAAFLYNDKLREYKIHEKYREVHEGDKIKFAYIKQPNAFGSDVIGFLDSFPKEWETVIQLDTDTMWEKAFEAPLEKIFGCLNWDIQNKTASLESFFG